MEKAMSTAAAAGGEPEVSRARLIVLRALYALIVVGLALFVWPAFLARLPEPAHYHGVVMTMLAAFSILCALGIRYPLQMLPLLLWELIWKSMWLLLIALPRWQAGTMDAPTTQTVIDCAPLPLLLLAIPWGYVARHYVRKPAERAPRAPGAASTAGRPA
jgi:hypothetical protein